MTALNNTDMIDMINGCWIGSDLARRLGLNSRFFSRFTHRKPKSLHDGISIQSTGGLVLVRIPLEISKLLDDSRYVVSKIEHGDDTAFDHTFNITDDTKIGFWK